MCTPQDAFYGVFYHRVANQSFLLGDEVSKIIAQQNSNRPKQMKRMLADSGPSQLLMVLGPYVGSTAIALEVTQESSAQGQLILTQSTRSQPMGLAVMNQSFWLARIPARCKVIVKQQSAT